MTQYHFPPIELLMDNNESSVFKSLSYVQEQAKNLDAMFASFKMDVKVIDYKYNDFAILLKLKLGPDVNTRAVRKLRADIELHMANPVDFLDDPSGHGITVAVKNIKRPHVALKDIIQSSEFQEAKSKVSVAAGLDLFGGRFVLDLASLPNLLVAGVTGSGKSVFLHDIILSILYKARPDEVKILLFDMKGIEFPLLNGIPHMLRDTIVDTETGLAVLKWLQNEKDNRLFQMKKVKADNIDEYNRDAKEPLPRIVLIIDEFMEYVRQKTEEIDYFDEFNAILEDLVKGSKETGIHMVLATQRPSNDVITPTIDSLVPCRASFVVVDKRESQIALNRTGAERLLGEGDMIFTRSRSDGGIHAQASYVSEKEINNVVAFLSKESGLFGSAPIV